MNTMSLAIMSGKGGVGKSNLSLNLGYSLAQKNHALLLMDCDLGLANLDVLLGITPEQNLQDVLLSGADVKNAIISLEKNTKEAFDILPAASGVPELTDMNSDMRDLLIKRINPSLRGYDIILMDLGAGIHGTVQSFAAMAAIRIIVLTPEPTALTDAYALIKVLSQDLGVRDFLVVVNDVASRKEEEITFKRLEMACQKFLNINPVLLGGVRHDVKLQESVLRQKPLLELFPESNAAQDIGTLADRILKIYARMEPHLEGQEPLRVLDKNKNFKA
ncbi:MinD/ParA family protein [Taurinivorans muris]|jgi:ATPases involved in chromosome partitioning|uniref:MinD/ParA family protein n=1 Tax=Taurinivorans muris TaxID=2787751 RepID=A0ABY5Y1G9_9BACT|nr:MinD/ParA family protein [Desulfovibrionaceae bacterium LT0009]HBV41017.1 flagellar synthesis regulator FleN [Desulfovibrio sp.]